MPAPAAPTNLTITPDVAGAGPTAVLAWEHTGTNLDKFEILTRRVGETSWRTVVLAPSSTFSVTATEFELRVISSESSEWGVRALNTAGEASG